MSIFLHFLLVYISPTPSRPVVIYLHILARLVTVKLLRDYANANTLVIHDLLYDRLSGVAALRNGAVRPYVRPSRSCP